MTRQLSPNAVKRKLLKKLLSRTHKHTPHTHHTLHTHKHLIRHQNQLKDTPDSYSASLVFFPLFPKSQQTRQKF